ncbi:MULTISPECIES: aminomethyltransferase family protein [unclassified Pseudofrankia]|uniref:aminomethyltransferase family protein n=1 Tax=unclassified Pseudofrankia TaxID=2994372 RepID=UPI0008D8DE0C|nr:MULTISPECIES: aminomethyltransferase family protein [unclassified Pseudofrankia]MDT3442807.1 aminomethyltransferase family protein [Pseudofrankia sp. BMG5.37]OHV74344.1 glycine cleavage system protein T [Pseudofrankia sp. BMG5.36]
MASLEDAIREAGDPLTLMRSGRSGAFPFPIRAEFTNWRDEQESWRTTAALMDLSHHMTDLTVDGPDCYRLLSDLGANTFKGFGPMKAKQFIACNHDGYMIGDCILFCLADNVVRLVGRPPALNWVQFHAETGGYDVTLRRDERTAQNPRGRELFRLQLQGPNAARIFEKVNGGPMPDIPFFTMGKFAVGSHQVTALNHRMSGFPGLEFFGPYAEIDDVRGTLLEAGAEFGVRQVGGRAYASVATESGWIASTVPALYTGDDLKAYREWQNARSFEANLSLGGSFAPDRVQDYYTTPWDLGYGHILKFDHDFIGRDALQRRKGEPHRRKAWLVWDRDDVARIFASMYEPADKRFKYIDMPAAFYSGAQFDRVEKDGRLVGVSTLCSYTSNVRGWISICMIDEDGAAYGDHVELVWGEPNGGSANPTVERHTQTTIHATVVDRPFPADKR